MQCCQQGHSLHVWRRSGHTICSSVNKDTPCMSGGGQDILYAVLSTRTLLACLAEVRTYSMQCCQQGHSLHVWRRSGHTTCSAVNKATHCMSGGGQDILHAVLSTRPLLACLAEVRTYSMQCCRQGHSWHVWRRSGHTPYSAVNKDIPCMPVEVRTYFIQCCQQGYSFYVWQRSGHTPCSAVNKATPCMSGGGQDILHAVLSTRTLLACLAEVRTYSMQCCQQGHSLHVWRRSGHTPCSAVNKDTPCMSGGGQDILYAVLSTRTLLACLAEVRTYSMQCCQQGHSLHVWRRSGHTPCSAVNKATPCMSGGGQDILHAVLSTRTLLACLAEVRTYSMQCCQQAHSLHVWRRSGHTPCSAVNKDTPCMSGGGQDILYAVLSTRTLLASLAEVRTYSMQCCQQGHSLHVWRRSAHTPCSAVNKATPCMSGGGQDILHAVLSTRTLLACLAEVRTYSMQCCQQGHSLHVWRRSGHTTCSSVNKATPCMSGRGQDILHAVLSTRPLLACLAEVRIYSMQCCRQGHSWHVWRRSGHTPCSAVNKDTPCMSGVGQDILYAVLSTRTLLACLAEVRIYSMQCCQQGHSLHVWRRSGHTPCSAVNKATPCMSGGGQDILHAVLSTRTLFACLAEVRTYSKQCCQQGHSLHLWRRSGHTPCSAVNKATPCMSGVGQHILHAVLSTRPLLACLAEVRTYYMQCCQQGHSLHVWRRSGHTPCSAVNKATPCMSGGGQDILHAVLSTRTLLACLAEVRTYYMQFCQQGHSLHVWRRSGHTPCSAVNKATHCMSGGGQDILHAVLSTRPLLACLAEVRTYSMQCCRKGHSWHVWRRSGHTPYSAVNKDTPCMSVEVRTYFIQCCQQGYSLYVWQRSGHTPCSAVNKATPCMSGGGQDILHAVLSTRTLLACLA